MERDFCILIHTVRIQTTVSLYSSSPDNYQNRESFYHVIIPSAQWSWRWVYWFHLVRPSPHYSPCYSPRYGWDAENWECGNILRVISALWLKCWYNAEISPYSSPNTPIRIFSAFPPHFFPYNNAEISPRSCPNTPICIFAAFPPHFFRIFCHTRMRRFLRVPVRILPSAFSPQGKCGDLGYGQQATASVAAATAPETAQQQPPVPQATWQQPMPYPQPPRHWQASHQYYQPPPRQWRPPYTPSFQFQRNGPCGRCGRACQGGQQCPALGKRCHQCGKMSHFSSVCRSAPPQ